MAYPSLKLIHENLRINPMQNLTDIAKNLGLSGRELRLICSLFLYNDTTILRPMKLQQIDLEDADKIKSPYVSYSEEINLEALREKFKGSHSLDYVKKLLAENKATSVSNHLLVDNKELALLMVKNTGMEVRLFKKLFTGKADKKRVRKSKKQTIANIIPDNSDLNKNNNNTLESANEPTKTVTLLSIHAYIQLLKNSELDINLLDMCNFFNFKDVDELNRHLNQFIYMSEIVSLEMLMMYDPEDAEFAGKIIGYFDPIEITLLNIESHSFETIHTFCQLKYAGTEDDRLNAIENCLRLPRGSLKSNIETLGLTFEGFQTLNMANLQVFAKLTLAEAKNLMDYYKRHDVVNLQPPSLRIAPLMNSTSQMIELLGSPETPNQVDITAHSPEYIHPIINYKRMNTEGQRIDKRQKSDTNPKGNDMDNPIIIDDCEATSSVPFYLK